MIAAATANWALTTSLAPAATPAAISAHGIAPGCYALVVNWNLLLLAQWRPFGCLGSCPNYGPEQKEQKYKTMGNSKFEKDVREK